MRISLRAAEKLVKEHVVHKTVLFIFVWNVGLVLGVYPFFWKCPHHFPVKQNFSLSKYLGRWYEIERFFETENLVGSCTVTDYSAEGNSSMSSVKYSIHKRTGKLKIGEGLLTPYNVSAHAGRFHISHKSAWDLYSPTTYWILDTDYGNYSLVWSCKNSGIINFQGVWFLSRTVKPTKYIRSKVYNKLRRLGIFTRILTPTDHIDCPRLGFDGKMKKSKGKEDTDINNSLDDQIHSVTNISSANVTTSTSALVTPGPSP